jgi:CubicO group peptidase (beta-lactamase class C family)
MPFRAARLLAGHREEPYFWTMIRMPLTRSALLVLLCAGSANAQQSQPITVGRAVERTLAHGEKHVYELVLQPGRFVHGRAVQNGVDLTVAIIGPQGDTIAKVDSPNGKEGPEPFQFTTKANGTHRIVIAPLESESGSGQYTLTVERNLAAATTPRGKVEQLFATLDPQGPGVAVGVVQDGKLTYQNAWGLANLTHKVPFAVDTRTNIGSTSKQFTAFAILLLVRQGKLSLDDDVRKHIPELPDLKQTVTIRHLLTHTSGYREYLNALALAGRQLFLGDYVDRDEIIAMIKRQPALQNAPGAEFNYNNSGYALASMIVERVSKQKFPDFLRDQVFRPLGMNNSIVRANVGQIIPNSSQGYVSAAGGFREAQDLGASMGAGGIYTTIGDLAKWVANYEKQTVGPQGFFQQMTARNVLTSGDTSAYGLGLFVDRWKGLARVHHGGADVAHRSALIYFPALRTGVTVQSNNASVNAESYANQIIEAFFGERLKEDAAPKPGAIAFDTTLFAKYAGRYALDEAPAFVVSFTRRGDKYYTQATGQPEVEMKPTSDSTFALTVVDASLTFHREADGSVKYVTLHQNGAHRATRVGAVAAPARPDMRAFVGRYFSEELETFYDITLEQDTLRLSGRRIASMKLTHVSGDRFNGVFPIANIAFERDAAGQVVALRAGNGRTRDVVFKREE